MVPRGCRAVAGFLVRSFCNDSRDLWQKRRRNGPNGPVEESEAYFHSRPRPSQLAATASMQSAVIPSRKSLIEEFKRLENLLQGQTVPLPGTWGGYRLSPIVFEFWRHRDNRLHDRRRYRKTEEGKWISEYLAP